MARASGERDWGLSAFQTPSQGQQLPAASQPRPGPTEQGVVVWAGLGMKMEMHLATEGTRVLGVG